MPVFDLGAGASDAAVSAGNDMAVALGSSVGSYFPLFLLVFTVGYVTGFFVDIRNGLASFGR